MFIYCPTMVFSTVQKQFPSGAIQVNQNSTNLPHLGFKVRRRHGQHCHSRGRRGSSWGCKSFKPFFSSFCNCSLLLEALLQWRQIPEIVDSAVFHQFNMQQQWTEWCPLQLWQIQKYVCDVIHVLEKKLPIWNWWPVLNCALNPLEVLNCALHSLQVLLGNVGIHSFLILLVGSWPTSCMYVTDILPCFSFQEKTYCILPKIILAFAKNACVYSGLSQIFEGYHKTLKDSSWILGQPDFWTSFI